MKPRKISPHYAAARQQERQRRGERKAEASMFRSVSMAAAPPSFADHGLLSQGQFTKTNDAQIHRVHSSPEAMISMPPPPVEHTTAFARPWTVTQLQTLPMYYPLEKTAVLVHPSSLAELTSNISNFLRRHSISCRYQDHQGRVDCLTDTLLKFSIQLWKAAPSAESLPDETSDVLVEVQRRSGCCIEMHHVRQELMHDLLVNNHNEEQPAEKKNTDGRSEDEKNRQLYDTFQALVKSTLRHEEKLQEHALDAFPMSLTLLQSSQLDQNRLGLESLSVLTDPYKVLAIHAQSASSRILIDPRIHSLLHPYFLGIGVTNSATNNVDDYDHEMDGDADRTIDYEQGKFFGAMHILALKALSRALDTWVLMVDGNESADSANAATHSSSLDLSSPFWKDVVYALLYNIQVSSQRPLEASLSVHSLRFLTRLAPRARITSLLHQDERFPSMDRILNQARWYGREHHRALERETEDFLLQLDLAAY